MIAFHPWSIHNFTHRGLTLAGMRGTPLWYLLRIDRNQCWTMQTINAGCVPGLIRYRFFTITLCFEFCAVTTVSRVTLNSVMSSSHHCLTLEFSFRKRKILTREGSSRVVILTPVAMVSSVLLVTIMEQAGGLPGIFPNKDHLSRMNLRYDSNLHAPFGLSGS